jgi:hypothetical protein
MLLLVNFSICRGPNWDYTWLYDSRVDEKPNPVSYEMEPGNTCLCSVNSVVSWLSHRMALAIGLNKFDYCVKIPSWLSTCDIYIVYRRVILCVNTMTEISFNSRFLVMWMRGTRCSWLRHYATSRKVAGSIPGEVIGFFNWSNPSSHTMALGLTQPLTEVSTRNLPGSKGLPARMADRLTAICESILGTSTSHNPMGLHGLLQG